MVGPPSDELSCIQCNEPSDIDVAASSFASGLVRRFRFKRASILSSYRALIRPHRVQPIMSKKMAGVLIAYGIVLVVVGFVLYRVSPELGKVTWITSFAGSGLCLLWGTAALGGLKGRSWAVLNVVGMAFVMVTQMVSAWTSFAGSSSERLTLRLLATVATVLTMGMLMYLIHGERPPEYYQRKKSDGSTPATGSEAQSRATRSRK